MRLDDEAESTNYEIRSGGSGFGLPIPLGRGGLGCGGIVVLGILALIMGVNPLSLIGVATDIQSQAPSGSVPGSAPGSGAGEKTAIQLSSLRILGSTERVWGRIFEQAGSRYEPTVLAFYPGGTQSGCGMAQSSMGPFYCPRDSRIYLDTSFFDELATRFGAPGDFAQAYVIAHEVGHHVQALEGRLGQVNAQQARLSEGAAKALQVKVELQADCYAGVWAANTKGVIEPGDIEEGLRAASAVGDDTLQKAAQGAVVPEAFTHGSAADRQKWLQKGLQAGDPRACDTFGDAGRAG